jgi:hypothetical protein
VLLAAGTALAAEDLAKRTSKGDGFRQEIELTPLFWQPSEASGTAIIEEIGERQLFAVNVKAEVLDGTTYVVVVSTPERRYVAGTITMSFGSGDLRRDYAEYSLLPDMPVVRRIEGVFIHDMDRQECAMEGWFSPPTSRSLPGRR